MSNIIVVGVAFLIVAVALAWWILRNRVELREFRTIRQHLAAVPLFDALNKNQLDRIVELTSELHIEPGMDLFREDASGDALYIVLEGRLNILRQGSVDPTLVKPLTKGAITGEMALLTGAPRNATGRAEVMSTVLKIAHNDFVALMDAAPDISAAVWSACETHTIENLIPNQPNLRSLTRKQQQAWINERTMMTVATETTVPPGASYAAIIVGELTHDETRHHAPALFVVSPGQAVVATSPSRVAWLTSPFQGGKSIGAT